MIKTTACAIGATVALAWGYLRHIQLAPGPSRLNGWDRQVFGHRGCRNIPGIPENTIEAFHYAFSNGAAGVELDVKLTKDKEIVVFHDGFIQPLLQAPEQRPIGQCTLEELRTYTYRDDPTGTIKIPTLEEAILFCRDNYLQLLIEIKERKDPKTMVSKILELYEKHGEFMYQNTTVISFSPFVLYAIRARNPKVAVCQLHCDDLLASWKKSGIEPLPLLVRVGPTALMDMILQWGQTRIAPWVMGASMVGPKYTLFTDEMRIKWSRRKILTYLWGFKDTVPAAEQFHIPMRQTGVFIAVDNHYAEYGSLVQAEKDQEAEIRKKEAAAKFIQEIAAGRNS
jgi:glycerophosphoryl diester phosphodiesterase